MSTPLPTIPRYAIEEEVGSGGMSVVYRARDTTLGREVAVKVLHRHLASRERERARFRREAQAIAKLRHPNILEIHDFSSEESGEAFIVSEFIRGPTLRAFGDEVGFGLPEIGAMVGERIAAALAHAHAQGVIHRDIKPENVMVQDDGTIKLTDFGIARLLESDERMTMTGTLLGSPAHMAPETLEGRGADTRSDVFSLGTVLYWLCCGTLPFHGGSPAEVLRRIGSGRYEDPRAVDPRVGDELAGIIRRALALDPQARYPDAGALQADLAAYLTSVGLEHVDAELRAFFQEPDAYKEALTERLLTHWLERGEAAAQRGELHRAVAAADRVLALRPGHPAAEALLGRIRRRRGLRRAAAGLAVAAAVGTVLVVVTRQDGARPVATPGPAGGRTPVAAAAAPPATAAATPGAARMHRDTKGE
ncbi:MAG: serine/threonine protein kinase, partial [Deltaproteobacteria bacterium]